MLCEKVVCTSHTPSSPTSELLDHLGELHFLQGYDWHMLLHQGTCCICWISDQYLMKVDFHKTHLGWQMSYRNDLKCETFWSKNRWRCLFRTGLLSSTLPTPWCQTLMPPTSLPVISLTQASFQRPHIFQLVPCSRCLTHHPFGSLYGWSLVYEPSVITPWWKHMGKTVSAKATQTKWDQRTRKVYYSSSTWARQFRALLPLEFFFRVVKSAFTTFKTVPLVEN